MAKWFIELYVYRSDCRQHLVVSAGNDEEARHHPKVQQFMEKGCTLRKVVQLDDDVDCQVL